MLFSSIGIRLDTFPGFDRSPGHGTAKGQVPGYWVPGRVQFPGPKFLRIKATIFKKKDGLIGMILCCYNLFTLTGTKNIVFENNVWLKKELHRHIIKKEMLECFKES